jgi:cytochrome c peroxidase
MRLGRVAALVLSVAALSALDCARCYSAEDKVGDKVEVKKVAGAEIGTRRFKIPKGSMVRLQAFKADPPEVALGERLFLETRFAQWFYAGSKGDANATLTEGDPVLARSANVSDEALPGPYAGLSMSCRACHLVAEQGSLRRGNRTYADFARRSPVPAREDGRKFTARNSPPMVNALVSRPSDLFLHFDGEFGSGAELAKATFTGRNFGWLASEKTQAVQHVAHIIRHDDGKGQLAREFGGYSYAEVFAGRPHKQNAGNRLLTSVEEKEKRFASAGEIVEEDYLLPEEYRLHVETASDEEILDAMGRAVTAYMESLFYSRDDQHEYDSSPFDVFLEKNKLPRKPDPGQSDSYYVRNLLSLIDELKEPRFVTQADKCFKTLKQDFRFGPLELQGLKIFFLRPSGPGAAVRRQEPGGGSRAVAATSTPHPGLLLGRGAEGEGRPRSIGNCVACHTPPHFTDFVFHNTGASQLEYDALHGDGAFANLFVPALSERESNYDAWLPPTPNHPRARGMFCDAPAKESPLRADLGLWNVFANPDQPAVQAALTQLLIGERRPQPAEVLLPRTIALFKTPTLRGLSHSHPYLHNGQKDTLEDVVRFYIRSSALMRAGKLRNGAPELADIRLRDDDVAAVAAFLRALNEDYE